MTMALWRKVVSCRMALDRFCQRAQGPGAFATGRPKKKGPSRALRTRSRRGAFDQILQVWRSAQFQILDTRHPRHAVVVIHPAFPPAVDPAGTGFKAAEGAKIPGFSFQTRLIASCIGAGSFVSLLSLHRLFLFLIHHGGKAEMPREQGRRARARRKGRFPFTRLLSVSASLAQLSNTKLQYHEGPLGISRILKKGSKMQPVAFHYPRSAAQRSSSPTGRR